MPAFDLQHSRRSFSPSHRPSPPRTVERGNGTKFLGTIFSLAFPAKNYDDTYTFTRRGFPLSVRHERGEGEGEGLPNEDGLLSPALSSIVPLEEREQTPFAFTEEFFITPVERETVIYDLPMSRVEVEESAAGPVNVGRTSANRFAPPAWVWLFIAVMVCLPATVCLFAGEPTAEQLEFFEQKVRPLLAERCYKCHSAQSEKLKGGLLLDSLEGVMKGGEDGPVLAPGEPGKSRLIEAVNYDNPDLQMPPKGKLAEGQIATLTEWVKLGAPWPKEAAPKAVAKASGFDLERRRREHWAWQPIKVEKPPAVKNGRWPANSVDHFILAKLEENHLQPAPPAERGVLLRRLYFDLVGLPPTPRETDDFVADNAGDAYLKVVDRLLASPHFGERWGRHWLDLVRYADTLGHEFDYPLQNAWRYRDYVIRAFNADVPYDWFVTEHIAGDLLPNPRRRAADGFDESVIGTGFFWLEQRVHSPVDVRQDEADVIANQIDVLSKTFLGLTVACARCHDHKFDAIAAKDFYSLYGVLESSHYAQRAVNSAAQISPKVNKLAQLKKQIRRETVAAWLAQADETAKYLMAANPPGTETNSVGPGNGLESARWLRWSRALQDKSVSDPGHPMQAWAKLGAANDAPTSETFAQRWAALVQEAVQNDSPTNGTNYELFADLAGRQAGGWFAEGDAFTAGTGGPGDFIVGDTDHPLAAILHEPAQNDAVVSRRLEGALRSPTFEIRRRYLHIRAAGQDARIKVCVDNFTMIRDPIYGGLKKYLAGDLPVWITFDLEMWRGHRAYIELCDVSTADNGDDKERDGSNAKGYVSAGRVLFSDQASPPAAVTPPRWLLLLGNDPVESRSQLARRYQAVFRRAIENWGLSGTQPATEAEMRERRARSDAPHLLMAPSAEGETRERRARSDAPYLAAEGEAQLAGLDWLARNRLLDSPLEPRVSALVAEYQRIESSIPEPVMVPAMADGDGVDERVFLRGSYKTPGEPAPRRFLTALAGENAAPFKQGSGRLELARCLTDPANPLLSRVMANRVWLHLFGRGLVPTPDDFGVLGQPPSHPELLDWLAHWYAGEAGWSTKKLVRLLVTSSTYRMAGKPTDKFAEEKDPDNLLFHRMPVRRLEGEVIRDSMLAISGRLDPALFGPPVPTHLTEFMDGRGRPAASGPLDGAGRRSIYLEVRRNFVSPMMRAFDTPVPFTTIGRRTVSNVPAQSLILMNDPFVIGQAQAWARRVLAGPPGLPSSAFGKCIGRLLRARRQPRNRRRRWFLSGNRVRLTESSRPMARRTSGSGAISVTSCLT